MKRMPSAYIQENMNPWLANSTLRQEAKLRLFCFPYSGAGASIFRSWLSNFPAEIEVCPVRLPGREERLTESPYSSLMTLVPILANALLPDLDRPFVFFGHSMGALLAFELSRYLKNCMNLVPLHLFVSAHAAPHLPRSEDPIHNLPEEQFISKLREMNGTADAVFASLELRQILLPLLRADFSMCETYQFIPGEKLDCSISAFGGLQDAYIQRSDLEAWSSQTRGLFKLRMFPGDHFFITKNPFLLIEVISRELYPVIQSKQRMAGWMP